MTGPTSWFKPGNANTSNTTTESETFDMSDPTMIPLAIDLETTGLHPVKDRILEFGMILAGSDLEEQAEFGSRVLGCDAPGIERMDPYVISMHLENGLLEQVLSSKLTLAELDAEVSDWLDTHGVGPEHGTRGILLGNSCRLDLYMIELQMPLTAARLTHRMIDVSGLRQALALLAPDVDTSPTAEIMGQGTAHRALDDARFSLRWARQLRSALAAPRP